MKSKPYFSAATQWRSVALRGREKRTTNRCVSVDEVAVSAKILTNWNNPELYGNLTLKSNKGFETNDAFKNNGKNPLLTSHKPSLQTKRYAFFRNNDYTARKTDAVRSYYFSETTLPH